MNNPSDFFRHRREIERGFFGLFPLVKGEIDRGFFGLFPLVKGEIERGLFRVI